MSATLARIRFTPVLDASAGADLLVEAVVEEALAGEAARPRRRRRTLPDSALLVSNTSSISITALAGGVGGPDRVAGMHFFNPVAVMRLVEVVRGQRTSEATVRSVAALAERLGKVPVVVNDFPGFVANRILLPMLNEACFALMEGVATREAMNSGDEAGHKSPHGATPLADLIGLDVCLHILEVLHRDLGDDKYRPCPLLRRMVTAGLLGRKSGAGFYAYGEVDRPG